MRAEGANERHFLGWHAPFLECAADFLTQRFESEASIDMSQVAVVAQVSRAGRRLLEKLIEAAKKREKPLMPPRFLTAAGVPGLLLQSFEPQASRLQILLAWIEALQTTKPELIKRLLPQRPREESWAAWLPLAERLTALYNEVSAANLTFASIANKCQTLPGFNDEERWHALSEVCRSYQAKLLSLGVLDRAMQCQTALEQGKLGSTSEIVLLAAADLSPLVRALLEKSRAPITALIQAPPEEAGNFDSLGCLIPKNWLNRKIGLDDRQIQVVDSLSDQAQSALETLFELKPLNPEEITIGICDPSLAPHLMQALKHSGLPCRYAAGAPAAAGRVFVFIKALAQFLNTRLLSDFASLLRHPDIYSWIVAHSEECSSGAIDFLSGLDHYQTLHLQARVDKDLPGDGDAAKQARALQRLCQELLGGVLDKKQALQAWAAPLSDLIVQVFGLKLLERDKPGEREIVKSCKILQETLSEINLLPPEACLPLSAAEALLFVLAAAAGKIIEPEPLERAIEVMGWLELSLDDAPELIICGMNEGFVPQTINSDPFLPDRLRKIIGLADNDQRCARDVFSLTAILGGSKRVFITAGRRDAAGDFMAPSRLLLAAEERKIAERVRRFYQPCVRPRMVSSGVVKKTFHKPDSGSNRFEIPPRPKPLPSLILSLPATAFRTYLDCPYVFYLKHVLNLKTLTDSAAELDAAAFGSIAHKVLEAFGSGPAAQSRSAEEIERFLIKCLELIFLENFGEHPLPAVSIQKQLLAARLSAFAAWQAGWAAQGWQIKHTELSFGADEFKIDLNPKTPGPPMGIQGRIDRVDYNPKLNEWAIFDYKTSDEQKPPEKTHRRAGRWIDLQLPIYRFYLESRIKQTNINLGYITLQANSKETGEAFARWSGEDLAQAKSVLRETASAIRLEQFYPPNENSRFSREYAAILGLGQLTQEPGEEAV